MVDVFSKKRGAAGEVVYPSPALAMDAYESIAGLERVPFSLALSDCPGPVCVVGQSARLAMESLNDPRMEFVDVRDGVAWNALPRDRQIVFFGMERLPDAEQNAFLTKASDLMRFEKIACVFLSPNRSFVNWAGEQTHVLRLAPLTRQQQQDAIGLLFENKTSVVAKMMKDMPREIADLLEDWHALRFICDFYVRWGGFPTRDHVVRQIFLPRLGRPQSVGDARALAHAMQTQNNWVLHASQARTIVNFSEGIDDLVQAEILRDRMDATFSFVTESLASYFLTDYFDPPLTIVVGSPVALGAVRDQVKDERGALSLGTIDLGTLLDKVRDAGDLTEFTLDVANCVHGLTQFAPDNQGQWTCTLHAQERRIGDLDPQTSALIALIAVWYGDRPTPILVDYPELFTCPGRMADVIAILERFSDGVLIVLTNSSALVQGLTAAVPSAPVLVAEMVVRVEPGVQSRHIVRLYRTETVPGSHLFERVMGISRG